MKVVFRTDASVTIGSGHLMRCLTLADELRRCAAEVAFICREHPGNMNELLELKGFSVKRLAAVTEKFVEQPEDVAHASWLGVTWQKDAAETTAAICDIKPDWLIVDGYAFDRCWEATLRPYAAHIMVIDDLADRRHDCDLLLDQNFYRNMNERYTGLIKEGSRKLLGPQFAMLRPQFTVARSGLRKRDGNVRRILIFFGGSDPSNETAKALEAFCLLDRPDISVDVVVGNANPHKHDIEQFCRAHFDVTFHCQINYMEELIAAADLYVGAAGTTTWERCCLGLPSLVVTVAANQILATSDLDQSGILTYLGDSGSVTAKQITSAIEKCISTPELLKIQSEKALGLVDGFGVSRCVEAIIQH